MKVFRIMILVYSMFMVLPLTGCQNKTISQDKTVSQDKTISSVIGTPATKETDETMQDYSKLFELELYSDGTTYNTSDKIKIWATLKYIGSNERIKIWHGDPYISFFISDGKDFNIGGIVNDVLSSTELKKGQLYRFDYTKNGGYAADEPKADFWKKFYSEKYLYLPEGEYTVKVATAFSLTEKTENNKSNLSKELKIVVTDSDPGSKSDELMETTSRYYYCSSKKKS